MGLPNYGTQGRSIPVLDHRKIASPWVPSAAEEQDERTTHEPTPAERARTVVGNNRVAVMAVVPAGDATAPVGFVVAYATMPDGLPVLALRPAVADLIAAVDGMPVGFTVAESPLTAHHAGATGGVTIAGRLLGVTGAEELQVALPHLARVQAADASAVKRSDAQLCRVALELIMVTSGTGDIADVAVADYIAASADPLAAVAPGLVAHLAGDANGTLVLLARAFGGQPGAKTAELVAVDQYGMELMVRGW